MLYTFAASGAKKLTATFVPYYERVMAFFDWTFHKYISFEVGMPNESW